MDNGMGLEDRLLNWRRWCMEPVKLNRCASIERLWRPGVWGDEADLGPPQAKLGPVDPWDAAEVERAVCSLQTKHKRVLKLCYVGIRRTRDYCGIRTGYYTQPRDHQIARWLRIKPRDIDLLLVAAKVRLNQKLSLDT